MRRSRDRDDDDWDDPQQERPSSEMGQLIASSSVGGAVIIGVLVYVLSGVYLPSPVGAGGNESPPQPVAERPGDKPDPERPAPERPGPRPSDRKPADSSKPPPPPPPPPPPDPRLSLGEETPLAEGVLAPAMIDYEELRITRFRLNPSELLPCMVWADDKKSFYCLEKSNGTLRHISLDGFKLLASKTFNVQAVWLSRSADGLLVSAGGKGKQAQFALVNLQTLEPISSATMPDDFRAVSSPNLQGIYVGAGKPQPVAQGLLLWDPKMQKYVSEFVPKQYPKNTGFLKPYVTPNGKYLLAAGGIGGISRFRIAGAQLQFEENGPDLTRGGNSRHELQLSHDSQWVSLPSMIGNEAGGITHIYSVTNLGFPSLRLKQGPTAQVVGFDPAAGLIYAQEEGIPLVIHTAKGDRGKAYKLHPQGENGQHFLVHPDGRKLLVLADRGLYYVEVKQ